MDDYKHIQLIISPDALKAIRTILITKKLGNGLDDLENQWAKIFDAVKDRKNSITIETKKDREKEGN